MEENFKVFGYVVLSITVGIYFIRRSRYVNNLYNRLKNLNKKKTDYNPIPTKNNEEDKVIIQIGDEPEKKEKVVESIVKRVNNIDNTYQSSSSSDEEGFVMVNKK